MEQPQEYTAKEEFYTYLQMFVRNNSACGLSVAELRTLLGHVNLVKANGLRHAERIFTDGVSNVWTWPNSIVFAATIVTTVGYGRLVPRTVGGQVFCIIYAVFGIPLCYFMLLVVGDTFQNIWHHSIRLFDKLVACIHSKRTRKVLGGLVTCVVLWIFIGTIPSVVLIYMEDWSTVEAQYFSFISLSTIGLGDIMYGMEHKHALTVNEWLYKICMLAYFIIGLAVISIIFRGEWRAQKARLKMAHETTRRFLQNRGGRRSSYALGIPPQHSSFRNSLFKRRNVSRYQESFDEDDDMDSVMAMDAVGPGMSRRKSSVFAMAYTSVLTLNPAGKDLGNGSCNNSLVDVEVNAVAGK